MLSLDKLQTNFEDSMSGQQTSWYHNPLPKLNLRKKFVEEVKSEEWMKMLKDTRLLITIMLLDCNYNQRKHV